MRGEPIALGPMIGEGVGEVVFSSDPRLREGEIVRGEFGWQKYAVTKLGALEIIDRQAAPLSTALGVLGMPGLTAYYGMLEVARPRAGETAVVTAAAGAVGSAAGIAKLQGCRVVGICGSDAKCMYLVNELNFDAAINYRSQPLDAALESASRRSEVLEALLRGPDRPLPRSRSTTPPLPRSPLADPAQPPGAHGGIPGQRLRRPRRAMAGSPNGCQLFVREQRPPVGPSPGPTSASSWCA